MRVHACSQALTEIYFSFGSRFPEIKIMSELTHRTNLRFVRFEAQKSDKKGLHSSSTWTQRRLLF